MTNYIINLNKINNSHDSFNFNVNDAFFKEFVNSEITSGEILINLDVKKKNENFHFLFKLNGVITNIKCDICTENISLPVQLSTNIIVQRTDKELEDTDEIIYISKTKNEISIKHLLFELITLSMPSRRRHGEKDKNGCNKEMITLIKKYANQKSYLDDSRWETLKKLKLK